MSNLADLSPSEFNNLISDMVKSFNENTEVISYPDTFIIDKWGYISLRFPKKKCRWYKRIMRHNYAK